MHEMNQEIILKNPVLNLKQEEQIRKRATSS